MGSMAAFARKNRLGFTLVELMAVVAITGILAVIGVVLVRRQIFSSRAGEASAMVQSIRAAQERWRSETGTYLDVSTTITSYYPTATPTTIKYSWEQPAGTDYAKWRLLNPTVSGPVQYGYTTKAGGAGTVPTTLTIDNAPTFAAQPEPWFVIQAYGDTDGDGKFSMYAATSMSPELYIQREGE